MKENVVIVNCEVPSEAYQILSMLRQDLNNESFAISQAGSVKMDAGHISLEDGFIAGDPVDSHGFAGSLIGSLVGVLGGPLGVLLGGLGGRLIGDAMDEHEIEDSAALLEKASQCLTDGETALLLLVEEGDETALPAKLKDFKISFTRMDAKEIAAEIENAEKQEELKAGDEEAAPELPAGE